jgi:hypothetical protein
MRLQHGNAQRNFSPQRVTTTACIALTLCLTFGCTQAPGGVEPSAMPLWVRSHNTRPVDVYALCGSRDAQFLGTIGVQGRDAFELPARYSRCAEGAMFFLVVQNFGRGYWVGPFRPQRSQTIQLVIEKYAGLSSAQLLPP